MQEVGGFAINFGFSSSRNGINIGIQAKSQTDLNSVVDIILVAQNQGFNPNTLHSFFISHPLSYHFFSEHIFQTVLKLIQKRLSPSD